MARVTKQFKRNHLVSDCIKAIMDCIKSPMRNIKIKK
jgi:hypothetical protein